MPDDGVIEWKAPPEKSPNLLTQRLENLKKSLQGRPGDWALVHRGFLVYAWWHPLSNDKSYEIKKVKQSTDTVLGIAIVEVYIRYVDEKWRPIGE